MFEDDGPDRLCELCVQVCKLWLQLTDRLCELCVQVCRLWLQLIDIQIQAHLF